MTVHDDFARAVKEMRTCQKQGTHEYSGKGVRPFKRRRARKYKCGTVLFLGQRRVLCNDCSKSLALLLRAFDPMS